MLTPEQVAALRDAATQVADPIAQYLIRDIARRVSEAGQLTSTAAYEVWRTQQLGMSQHEIKKRLEKLLKKSQQDIEKLLAQSAEVGYNFDLSSLPHALAVPFEQNTVMQQIVSAAVKLAQDDFTNITQTLGMVDHFGNAQPLQDVYRSATDFAFKQASTGATDYNTAIRQATANIAKYGIRTIDYESGVHTSLEAAVRRNIMGGLGLMQEQISQQNHDALGANGWEISAHAGSAPDHEDIQGKQYTDAEYIDLNGRLHRRIGTLNCGHSAHPIIIGISKPQYSNDQLRKFREDNAEGISYEGRHFTKYEATQMQRKLERSIRAQKRRVLLAEGNPADKDRLLTAQIKLTRLNQEYGRFSHATGLRTQQERMEVSGFGSRQATRATAANTRVEKLADSMYDIGSTRENVAAYLRDQPIRDRIQSDTQPKIIDSGQFRKHVTGTLEYNQYVKKLEKVGQHGPSRLSITQDEAQMLIEQYHGTGILGKRKDGSWNNIEEITAHAENIGVAVNNLTGAEADTTVFKIHYGKKGTHIVPGYPSRKGVKAIK